MSLSIIQSWDFFMAWLLSITDIISMFQPMVFQESDFICKEGTQADEMFFLVKGKCFLNFMFYTLFRCTKN